MLVIRYYTGFRGDHPINGEIERLMNAKRGTPEVDRPDLLVTLVEAWEAKHDPLDPKAEAP